MVRRPAGWHPDAGSGVAYGYRPVRPPAVPQEHYWRRTVTELHAGATSVIPAGAPFTSPGFGPATPLVAFTGPQAAGERWAVDLIQVQTDQSSSVLGQAPLVVQQIVAQQTGITTTPPPPIVVQAWRCHSSMAGIFPQWQTGKLLAQTTQGNNDTLGVSGVILTAGEVIAVVWYNWVGILHSFPFAVYQGTRYALSVT